MFAGLPIAVRIVAYATVISSASGCIGIRGSVPIRLTLPWKALAARASYPSRGP